ncbi:unnamed protein product [Zymoseptoria tritici ST99CH_1A5]|uniref:Uncharacterized protein n=2 Tax=Zymoseptoria tritici TaxID=1047171 RepID=A0A2H1GXV9_ZYMTR|nr:unnamed protein product [Zymoseptoria tritici ST99CH_1E4]SMR61372.1 unnamed protein product [Zymoseptoria tritici ST99CH_3D1]SMY27593.1 unnamed protein product [Zymoseptoria tritici ST99CH_1A5]
MAPLQPRKTSPATIRILDHTMDQNDDLTKRIQTLPQELQDSVLEEVLHASMEVPDSINGKVIAIDANYKPPLALQINRKQREILAKEYYNNTIFLVEYPGLRRCAKWLSTLTSAHLQSIKTINYPDPRYYSIIECAQLNAPVDPYSGSAFSEAVLVARLIEKYSGAYIGPGSKAVVLRPNALKVELRFRQSDGSLRHRWYREGRLENEQWESEAYGRTSTTSPCKE